MLAEPMPDLLTAQEIAEKIRISPRSVKRAIQAGELAGYLIRGRYLSRPEWVEEWLDQHRVEPVRRPSATRSKVARPAPGGMRLKDLLAAQPA